MTCTYRFIGANGKQTVIKGQAAFKAFLADGGLEQLRGEAAPKFSGRQAVPQLAPEDVLQPDTVAAAKDAITKYKKAEAPDPLTPEERAAGEDLLRPAFEAAQRNKPGFDSVLDQVAEKVGGYAKKPGIKKMQRAVTKLATEQEWKVDTMKDLLRGTIVVSTFEEAQEAIDEIGKVYTFDRIKNRLSADMVDPDGNTLPGKPLPTGYQDILTNVVLEDGTVAEIQISTPEMIAAKNLGHEVYAFEREMPNSPVKTRMVDLQKKIYSEGLGAYEGRAANLLKTRANSAASIGSPFSRTSEGLRGLGSGTQAVAERQSGATVTGTSATSKNIVPGGKDLKSNFIGTSKQSIPENEPAGKAAPKLSRKQGSVLDRIPALETAAQGLKEGTVTREQYNKLVNKLKPVTPYAEVPAPATVADMERGLTSDKVERIGVPSETLKAGDPVGLRLDIPAYSNNGVWVVSVHEQGAGYSAGKSIGYESVAAVTNPTFGVVEKAALAIAGGKPKATIAVMKGDWKPITPKQASTSAKAALKSEKWVQVGMDPTRHAYFYDRDSMEPVVSADEAIQIGPLVLAKNPVYGKKSDFAFSKRQQLRDAADAIAKMDPDIRDNTQLGDFPGAAAGYMLYEARILAKKPTEKLKRVNENNSFALWQQFDYIANVDGEYFGVAKQEDPDEPDDESKFVYSFEPLDASNDGATTATDQTDELFKEMRASLGGEDTNGPFTVAFSTRQQAPNTWPSIEEPDGSEAKPGESITVLRLASMEGLDNVNAASLKGLYSYLSMIDDNETGAGSEAAESDTIYAYKVTVPANGFGDYRLMGKGKVKTGEAAVEAGRQKAKYGGYWYSFPEGTEAEMLGSIPLADARKAAAKAERASEDAAPWRKQPLTDEEAAKLKGNFDFIGTAAGTEALREALGLNFSRRQAGAEMMGINVNQDGDNAYADKIIDGEKTIETRASDSLRPYVGKRVAIVRTGAGPAKAIGEVTIGEPIVVKTQKEFDGYRDQTLVPKGSKFDIAPGGVKYLYPVSNPVRYEQERDVGTGIVARKVIEPKFSKRNIFGQPAPLANWTAPLETKADNVIYALQDKQIDTKRVIEAITQAGNQIENDWNVYLQEELFHGRTSKQTTDFLQTELRPLVEDMQKRNVTLDQLEEYLHNRHAEERNEQIAKVNPNMPDGGSGIDTADAKAYLDGLTPDQKRDFTALAARIDAINQATRDLLVNSGLESQETVDAWEKAYSNYVPLYRDDIDFSTQGAGGMATGQGYSVKGAAARRAMGSKKAVIDILANIAMQRERTIVRAEKNRVAMSLYGLAVQNPNTDFWLAIDPAGQKDPNRAMADLMTMGISPLDAKSIIEEPKQRYVDPNTGLVAERINPAIRSNPMVIATRIDGVEKYVFFNANDERSQRMASALKNLDADQLGYITSNFIAPVTRWFAQVNTQFNPIFGAINFIRDVQGGVFNLSSTVIAGEQATVAGEVFPAMKGIYQATRAERKGRPAPAGSYAQLWDEFQQVGGQTGYRDQFVNSEDRAKALQRMLDPASWATSPLGKVFTANGTLKVPMEVARKTAAPLFDWLSDYNQTMENAVRLAAYKVALDKGLSKEEAASIAKNLTVNFNRKGQLATQAGAWYAFFNAAIQSNARYIETLRSPAGKKIIAGGLMIGTAQALLLAAAGFDEDEPPDFIKERNLVIPLGTDGKYFTFPMPLGFNVIPNTSRVMTEWALSGFKNTPKRIGLITGAFLETFNPIGNSGWSAQTLAPTIADPLVALAENRDFTGKPIAKKDRSELSPTPGYTRTKDTASWFSKQLSYYLNLATGGTDFKPGLFSPTPDQIDYLIGQITGGVGREAMKVEQSITGAIKGEEVAPYKIPIVGRFYGDTQATANISGKFYENLTMLNKHEAEINGRKKRGEKLDEYYKDNPEARLYKKANDIESDITRLRKRLKALKERKASDETIKLVNTQITAKMKRLNTMVKDAEK